MPYLALPKNPTWFLSQQFSSCVGEAIWVVTRQKSGLQISLGWLRKGPAPRDRGRRSQKLTVSLWCPAGNIAQLTFTEDISVEDDQALSQGRHKRKRKKLLEKAELEKKKGEL
jgi:hypothetical protein